MRQITCLLALITILGVDTLGAQFTLTPAVDGLFQPVDLAFNNIEDRHFIVEKPGRIRSWTASGLDAQPYLDISNQVNNSGGEQGMLGLAFSPNFLADSSLFVYYITFPNNSRISRFRALPGATTVDPATEQVLLEFAQPRNNHNGGSLAFGADGYLYVASGDGGGAGDPDNYAQNLQSFLGKMLRLDVTTIPGTYQIPSDNPFVNDSTGALWEIWSYGWRNPWRHSFDRETGDMWVADVGQNAREEINREPAGNDGGGNYGWRCREGDIPFNQSGNCDGPFVEPIHTYVTNELEDGCSVSGGAVYRGDSYPVMEGKYYYTDFCSGKIFELQPSSSGGFSNREIYQGADQQYAAIREDIEGNLYVIAFVEGVLYELANTCPSLGTLEVNQPVCSGDFGSFDFTATSSPLTETFTGIDVGTPDSPNELIPGTYGLRVNDPTGCEEEYIFTIEEGEVIEAELVYNGIISEVSGQRYASYQWIHEGMIVQGATDSTVTPSNDMDGTWQLVVTSQLGCTDTAEIVVVIASTNDFGRELELTAFPNPASGSVTVSFALRQNGYRLQLRSVDGRVMTLPNAPVNAASVGKQQLEITLPRRLPTGSYALELVTSDGTAAMQLLVQ